MDGKQYSEEVYTIRLQLEDLSKASKEQWQDKQAEHFGNSYIEPICRALSDMVYSIEHTVYTLDSKLQEIKTIAGED